jgi:hypothetical protein
MSVETSPTHIDARPGSRSRPSVAIATADEVAEVIASHVMSWAGADFSNVGLLSGAGNKLHVFHASVLDATIAGRYTDLDVDESYPITQAAMGHVVLLPNLDAYLARFPNVLIDTVVAGYQSSASVPMFRADGSLLGAIGFAWTSPMQFDAETKERLESIVLLCTEAIERAEHYDAEHALVLGLQDGLHGDLPPLAGVRTSVRTLPLLGAPSVGGDWYEGLTLTDSRIAVVIGDMCGHGVAAAADMASIRGMISALFIPVSRVFGEVTDVLDQRDGMWLATAALAVVDVADAKVTFATAGHPPPLLRFPDGRVHRLSTANGPLIGGPVSDPLADTAPFPRGSQLVMCTDGLVERRNQPFNVGVDRATRHLAASPQLHNEQLITSLLNEMAGNTEPEDDIAIIVIEHS